MFVLKKTISALMMPLPLLLIIGFLGLFCLIFTQRHKIGTFFVSISLVGLFLVSFQPISTSLLKPMEQHYPVFIAPIEKNIDYVVVLGAGHIEDNSIPISSTISRNALMRLAEGIRIQRMYPNSKLIVTGYKAGSNVSGALMMANVAVSLGVDKSNIILLDSTKNTNEEAMQTAEFVKDKQIVLVTSANHMTRAMKEFTSVGLSPIPAPANFIASDNINQFWQRFIPQSKYLSQTEYYWHEKLGDWWQSMSNDKDNIIEVKKDKIETDKEVSIDEPKGVIDTN